MERRQAFDLGFDADRLSPVSVTVPGHYTTCAKRAPPPEALQGSGERQKSDNAATEHEAPSDEEEQWMFFDDRVGMKKDMGYVVDSERNQRNCYMALYALE